MVQGLGLRVEGERFRLRKEYLGRRLELLLLRQHHLCRKGLVCVKRGSPVLKSEPKGACLYRKVGQKGLTCVERSAKRGSPVSEGQPKGAHLAVTSLMRRRVHL